MEMRTAKRILGLTLMFVAFAVTYASAQQAMVQDVKSLAGKWVGWATPTSGSNVIVEVDVNPDGTYTSKWGSTMGQGVIKNEGGKLMAEGNLITGAGVATAGTGRSELTLSSKNGKQVISGNGRDQQGPYSFQLTKR
jgi:hypothetical protein